MASHSCGMMIAAVSPQRTSVIENTALSAAITTSHAEITPVPPPKQPPCTSATVGIGNLLSRCTASRVARETASFSADDCGRTAFGAFAIVRDHRNSSTSTPAKNAPPPAAPIGTPATKPPSPTSAAPANGDHRLKNGYTIALEKIQKTPPTLPPGAICSRGSATGTCLVNPVTTTGFPSLVYDKATKQLLPDQLTALTG